jgi:hypothetical protein
MDDEDFERRRALEIDEAAARRALEIDEDALGPDHPDTGASVSKLAQLLQEKGDHSPPGGESAIKC